MFLVFYKTSDVFDSEEILQSSNISVEVVPTPVQDKAYCGVCLQTNHSNKLLCENLLREKDLKILE